MRILGTPYRVDTTGYYPGYYLYNKFVDLSTILSANGSLIDISTKDF